MRLKYIFFFKSEGIKVLLVCLVAEKGEKTNSVVCLVAEKVERKQILLAYTLFFLSDLHKYQTDKTSLSKDQPVEAQAVHEIAHQCGNEFHLKEKIKEDFCSRQKEERDERALS